MDLEKLRVEINSLDKQIVELLEKRMSVSKRVGEYKEQRELPVLNINRELEVIKKVLSQLHNKSYSEQLANIYFEIMKTSRSLQSNDEIFEYGLIGEKLSHSISPIIHSNIFNKNGYDASYGLFEIEKHNLKDFINNFEKYGIKGFQVTIPYKIEIMQYLDEIDEVAKGIGSVNTVKVVDGKKIGYNTDYFGFVKLLELNNINIENKNVIILGTGGSSKTCEYYCKKHNAKNVYLVSRNKQNKNNIYDYNDIEKLQYDVIINTTPVGMYPNMDLSPVDEKLVNKAVSVVDIIYNPKQTKFLKYAKSKKSCNGLGMLLAQAVQAQAIWGISKYSNELLEELTNENYGY